MEVPNILDLDWQRAIKAAVRPLLPGDFYGQITLNVLGDTMGDIKVYFCLREPKARRALTTPSRVCTVRAEEA